MGKRSGNDDGFMNVRVARLSEGVQLHLICNEPR